MSVPQPAGPGAGHPDSQRPGERLRASCARTLAAWSPPTADQDDLRQDYLEHLSTHPHGWSRDCAGAHLTASSLICAADSPRVLLTLHSRLRRWLQTGGHLEPGDSSLEAAALREAGEESGLAGLELDPAPLLLSRHEVPCGTVRPTYHLDVQFLVRATAGDEPQLSPESLDLRWFAADTLPVVDDSVRALTRAAVDRLGWASWP